MDKEKAINDIFEKVRTTIAEELKIDKEKITMESKIADELGAKSLDEILLLMELEDQFDSTIPQVDAQNFIAVSDIVNYIQDKLTKKV